MIAAPRAGFTEGWIEFAYLGRLARMGGTTLETVIAELVRAG